MPSFDHELLIEFLRRRPQLVRELLAQRRDVEIASDGVAELASIDLSQIAPPQYFCDSVIIFRAGLDAPPHQVIIVENQRSVIRAKRDTWPVYVAVARARYRCPVQLVVFADDPVVARWAVQPIEMGHPGFVLQPIVLQPRDVPRVTDLVQARASPELAVFSAVAHPEREVAAAAVDAVIELTDERKKLYFDIILRALPRALSDAILETTMQRFEYKSDFARENYEKGHVEGREEARRETLRELLGLKFGALSAETEARIADATPAELKRFIERVLSADSLAMVLAD